MTTHLINMIAASLVACVLLVITIYEAPSTASPRVPVVSQMHRGDIAIEAGESIVIYAPAGYAAVEVHASCNLTLALAFGSAPSEVVSSPSGFFVSDGKTAYTGRCNDGRVIPGTIELHEHEGADPLVRMRPIDDATRYVEGTVAPNTTLSVGTQRVAVRGGAFGLDVEHSVTLRAENPNRTTEIYVLQRGSHGPLLVAQQR